MTMMIFTRMPETSRACPATYPSSLPRAYLIGRPAVCCGVVLPVCPCVVFCKVHEHDTHDLLRISSRGCHEDATSKTASVEFKLTAGWSDAIGLDVIRVTRAYDFHFIVMGEMICRKSSLDTPSVDSSSSSSTPRSTLARRSRWRLHSTETTIFPNWPATVLFD